MVEWSDDYGEHSAGARATPRARAAPRRHGPSDAAGAPMGAAFRASLPRDRARISLTGAQASIDVARGPPSKELIGTWPALDATAVEQAIGLLGRSRRDLSAR